MRLASAAILAPVVLVALWFGAWPTVVLTGFAVALALWELYMAVAHGHYAPRMVIGQIGAQCLVAGAALSVLAGVDRSGMVLAGVVLGSLAAELPRHDRSGMLSNWALTLAGVLYIAWPLAHLILLAGLSTPLGDAWLAPLRIASGPAWIYMVLMITWANDTGAYFAGRALGRHRMSPEISPKKTWEGAIAGFAASLAGALLAVPLLGLPLSLPQAALLGVTGGLLSPIGDLGESLIKRQSGVKDSGSFIPGHGGMLDRVDSLLFTAPVLYYLVVWMVGR